MPLDTHGGHWFALQVRSRWERSTAALLDGKGYETLLPTFTSKRRWKDGFKEASAPLFPGYVFCRFDVFKRLPILVTPGVIAVVGRGRVPVPVSEPEIFAIQKIISSGVAAEPAPYLEVGQRVRIEAGALAGLEGILTEFKRRERIVISVSLLCRSIALEIDTELVSPARLAPDLVSDSIPSQSLVDGMIVRA